MNQVEIVPACLRDATYVVANMRERDRQEISCQLTPETRDLDLAYGLLMGCDGYIAKLDDRPVFFFGTSPMNVACLSVWGMGTRHTRRVIGEVTRFLVQRVIPDRMAEGYVTMEARSHVDHAQAHRWMRSTGAVVVGDPFVYGRDREKFLLFRWTDDVIGVAAARYGVTRCPTSNPSSSSPTAS